MRRLLPVLAVALLLAVPVTGCLGGDSPGDGDGGDGSDPGDEAFTAESPQWEIGYRWTYTAETANVSETEAEMLMYGDDGQNYRIGATNRDQALVHAVTNVNPQIGRIQKGNLAVYEDGQPRAMYDFPLEDGKTWQTQIFVSTHGGTLTAEATYNPAIDTGVGTYPGFTVNATNDEGFQATYDYVPEVQWYSYLRVEKADGTLLHELDLEEFTTVDSGTGWFVRGSDLLPSGPDEGNYRRYTPSGCGAPAGCTDSVAVDGTEDPKDDGQYDVVGFNLLVAVPDPNNDRANIEITDGGGNTVYQQSFLEPQESKTNFTTVRDFEPGEWTVDVTLHGNAEVAIKMAGGWEYSGEV